MFVMSSNIPPMVMKDRAGKSKVDITAVEKATISVPVVWRDMAKNLAAMVPKRSNKKPLASVMKLFKKEATVKTRENCSS